MKKIALGLFLIVLTHIATAQIKGILNKGKTKS
jgi:hypothetical protein